MHSALRKLHYKSAGIKIEDSGRYTNFTDDARDAEVFQCC